MFFEKLCYLILVIMFVGLISNPALAKSSERVYWIASDEVQWDYAPSFPTNPMSGNESKTNIVS